VIRGSVGFLTFFLAFALRHLHAATWWFGFVLLTSAIGSLLGSLLVPVLRRYLSEQQLILYSLVLSALVGVIAAVLGSLWAQPLLTLAIGFATTAAKPSFDSIAQRHVPPALLGRAFAKFETQLQLVWVLCALLAVIVGFSLQAGDVLIGVTCAVAAGFHVSMRRAVTQSRLEQHQAGRADLPGPSLN
jgi:MFS-type transporter involved in bile tolerance (Atg22 family)